MTPHAQNSHQYRDGWTSTEVTLTPSYGPYHDTYLSYGASHYRKHVKIRPIFRCISTWKCGIWCSLVFPPSKTLTMDTSKGSDVFLSFGEILLLFNRETKIPI